MERDLNREYVNSIRLIINSFHPSYIIHLLLKSPEKREDKTTFKRVN